MSFRLRVLALVSLVAVIAAGATAYLALTQASRQVNESVAADRQTTRRIVDELTGYARRHGTWERVAQTVRELAAQTRQRIKLVTESGTVIVDTDTLKGRTARAVATPPVLANPRPSLTLPVSKVVRGGRPEDAALQAIWRYRAGVRFAACLTRHRLGVVILSAEFGVPNYSADGDAARTGPETVIACRAGSASSEKNAGDSEQVRSCRLAVAAEAVREPTLPPGGDEATVDPLVGMIVCLQRVFAERTIEVAPVPLQVYLGATGDAGPSLARGPVIGAAGLVALLVVAGTALLSRRVLRPIGTLTTASQRIGEGELIAPLLHLPLLHLWNKRRSRVAVRLPVPSPSAGRYTEDRTGQPAHRREMTWRCRPARLPRVLPRRRQSTGDEPRHSPVGAPHYPRPLMAAVTAWWMAAVAWLGKSRLRRHRSPCSWTTS